MVCLVTGSSRGLGRSIALAFGKRQYKVVVHYKVQQSEAKKTALQISESIIHQADVRVAAEVNALVSKVIDQWGRIDVLVNNAGITKEGLLFKTSLEDFDEVMNTNLKGPYNFIKAVLPHMMHQKIGHIINISSYAGVKGKEGLSVYSASKAALLGMIKSVAREVSSYGIMVNAVLPGYMLTDMGAGATEKAKQEALKDSLLRDYSNPDHVAEFICSLSESTGITGQMFNLDSRIL